MMWRRGLKDALDEILNCTESGWKISIRKPSLLTRKIIPDFVINIKDGKVTAALNSKNAPQLRVSDEYKDILTTYSNDKTSQEHKQAALFIKQKLDAQNDAIIQLQNDYFIGDEKSIKPMISEDVADITGSISLQFPEW
ncbi:hypothetical protein FQR65_LT15292 [Abscondita terminalis]|nr:hypothetical protein FQR65_LT15292 [Abscondita terminalis]